LSAAQKASSKLTLVLCPAILTERMTTDDFIAAPHPFPSDLSGATRLFLAENLFKSGK
jgi:hypothetical protein